MGDSIKILFTPKKISYLSPKGFLETSSRPKDAV